MILDRTHRLRHRGYRVKVSRDTTRFTPDGIKIEIDEYVPSYFAKPFEENPFITVLGMVSRPTLAREDPAKQNPGLLLSLSAGGYIL